MDQPRGEEEPTSLVTGIYNRIMAQEAPKSGISCHIVPRKQIWRPNNQRFYCSTAAEGRKLGATEVLDSDNYI